MATIVPSTTVRLKFAPLAGDSPESALLIAPIGAGGTGVPGERVRITSAAHGSTYFGNSQGARACAQWFALGMGQVMELYAFGLDVTGWIANTWTLTVTGPATESGTLWLRLGSDTIAIDVADTETADAIAAKIDAAVTAANVPYTSGAVAAVVTLTSTYVGAAINRVDVSIDKYVDRGELGVEGVSVAVVNNAIATGEPATLDTANLGQSTDVWYLFDNFSTAFLNSLETWANLRWDNSNHWLQPFSAFSSVDEAAYVAAFGARNENHRTTQSIADTPAYELEAAVSLLRAVKDEEAERGTVPISTENRPLQLLQAPSKSFDQQTVLDAGGGVIVPVNGQPRTSLIVNSRRKDDTNADDFRFFDLGIVLAVRTLLGRIKGGLDLHRTRAILESTPAIPEQAPYVTSTDLVRAAMESVMVTAWQDALILGATEDQVRAYVTAVVPQTAGGTVTGWTVNFEPRAVSLVKVLLALVTLRGSAQ